MSGKDKNLDSLLDPMVDIMITKGVMVYCVQETWIVGNLVVIVREHMIFLNNRVKRVQGTRGRNPGGVAIILAPNVVDHERRQVRVLQQQRLSPQTF